MANFAYQVYLWCIPIVALLALAGSVSSRRIVDHDLFKAAAAVMAQTASVQAYFAMFDITGQPWLFHVISLAICAYVVTERPAGVMSGVIGGIIGFGIATAGFCRVYQIFFGPSQFADWAIWFCIFTMACLNLLALAGWSCGNIGNRFIVRHPWAFNRPRHTGAER